MKIKVSIVDHPHFSGVVIVFLKSLVKPLSSEGFSLLGTFVDEKIELSKLSCQLSIIVQFIETNGQIVIFEQQNSIDL